MEYTTTHLFKLFVLVLGIVLISCKTGQSQSWITSGDTVSSTGTVKAADLNITGTCVKFTGLVTDTVTDFLGLSVTGKTTALNGIAFNNLLYPMAPPLIFVCDTTIPRWYKQSIFGGSALVTMPCTWVGIGESGISHLPDAPLSISDKNVITQFTIVNPISTQDIFTIDRSGNTYTAGNVGIATTNMTAPLNVNTSSSSGLTSVFLNGSSGLFLTTKMQAGDYNSLTEADDNGIFWADDYEEQNGSSGLIIAPWSHSGSGIGIRIAASGKVDMEGVANGSTALIVGSGNVGVGTSAPNSQLNIQVPVSATTNAFSVTPSSGNDLFDINPNGNVLIQTTINSYPLNVGGTIWCNEIKVCLSGCDFVFDKGYKLMPLNELENYLELNHHLPGIASAKEMETTDGVALGKLNSQLLQKVEELTLYTIQLKKQLDEMQAEITKMSAGIPSGKERK